jgi:uncharacterized protein YaaQ
VKKMVLAIIPRDQASLVLETLITSGYPVTFTESRGGVLRQAQYMLYTCVDEEALDGVLRIIRENCSARVEVETEDAAGSTALSNPMPVTAELGGAVVFIWDVGRMDKY